MLIASLTAACTCVLLWNTLTTAGSNVNNDIQITQKSPAGPKQRSLSHKDYDDTKSLILDNLSNNVIIPSVDSTPTKYRSLDLLKDVFISVKTTEGFHRSRLDLILKTWYLLAREQVSSKTVK